MIEFCGNEKVIALTKDLISIFLKPLFELYQVSDLGGIISLIKDMISATLQIAENRLLSPKQCFSAYLLMFERFENQMYSVIHSMAQNDTGIIQSTTDWVFSMVPTLNQDSSTPPFNLFEVIKAMDNETAQSFTIELAELDEYFWKKKLQRNQHLNALREFEIRKYQQSNPESHLITFGNSGKFGNVDIAQFGMHDYLSDDDIDDLTENTNIKYHGFTKITQPDLPVTSLINLNGP